MANTFEKSTKVKNSLHLRLHRDQPYLKKKINSSCVTNEINNSTLEIPSPTSDILQTPYLECNASDVTPATDASAEIKSPQSSEFNDNDESLSPDTSTNTSTEIESLQSSATSTTDLESEDSTCSKDLLLTNIIEKKYLLKILCEKSRKFHALFINKTRVQYFESIQNDRLKIVSYFVRNAKALNENKIERKRIGTNVIFLATSIADTYLMKYDLDIPLELFREAIWRLACKYENRYSSFVYVKFNKSDVCHLQRRIFRTLNFNINIAHVISLLEAFVEEAELRSEIFLCTQFILEIIIHHYNSSFYISSRLAAAALLISLLLFYPNNYSILFTSLTDFQPRELVSEISYVHQCLRESTNFAAHIIEKYSTTESYEIVKLLFKKK